MGKKKKETCAKHKIDRSQNGRSNNHCKQANCLLSFTRRHRVPTSVPSSFSCTYARYELTTLVGGTAAFSAYGLILTQMSHINQLLTTSLVNSNSQDFFVKTKTKTKTLFFVLEAPRDQDCGLEDYITAIGYCCEAAYKCVCIRCQIACKLRTEWMKEKTSPQIS